MSTQQYARLCHRHKTLYIEEWTTATVLYNILDVTAPSHGYSSQRSRIAGGTVLHLRALCDLLKPAWAYPTEYS